MNRRLAIGLGTAAAVLGAGGGVAVLAWPDATEPTSAAAAGAEAVTVLAPDPAATPPKIKTELNTVDIAAPAGGGDVDVPERETKRFSLLGITWSDPAAAPKGTIQVKTRGVAGGKWTGWQSLERSDDEPDGAEAADSGRRGSTVPIWVGPSDGVAVRIAGAGDGLPRGMRLDLVDPGSPSGGAGGGAAVTESPSPEPSVSSADPAPTTDAPAEPTGTAEPAETTEAPAEPVAPSATTAGPEETTEAPAATTAPAPAATTAKPSAPASPGARANTVAPSAAQARPQFPAYVSRAGWSADERIVKSISKGTEVRALWVHHTATTNDYACADSAAIVRSIQTFHVKSNGWSDIGYNYLVDKCGKLYEGRKGGVEEPIVGAQTQGFNTNYAGIAVIGDFRYQASSSAIETTIAQVAAARLTKYGYNPASTVTVKAGSTNDKFKINDSVTLQRISGHRDGDATVCPGDNLYTRLGAIRSRATQQVTGLTLKVSGGGVKNNAYYVKKTAGLSWSLSTPTANLARFEVYVDNRKVSTPAAAARSASVILTPGRHTVAVRAVHVSGLGSQVGATVYSDVTVPAWTAGMAVNLRTGTYSTTSAPVTLTLSAKDNLAFTGFTVTSPRRAALGPATRAWNTTVKPGTSTYTVTARDLSGNAKTAQIKRKVSLLADTSAKKTGAWTTVKKPAHLNGKALSASAKGRKLTWTFSGRTAALLFSKTAKSGKVAIWVDGKKVSTVDLRSSKNAYRQAVWTRNLSNGKHKIMIEVLGTSGRPTVISDGLVFGN
ncbi:N-acetylmuramoyl-L-alanine amidase [Actinoplanes sp. DH11]|uniref:N-acetylmuramoyl-L-alanine amidase n=1 Tax=Actinoplanes sp. DH11 TaxID=2857011 RepID=UPI001E4448C2|nr:N-acetylmuramoyl-L-alanine amidase [Actinoplanes sp. DH11]